MSEKLLVYQAYLLRLWRDHAAAPWRATLIQVARPDAQRHFASVDELLAFLFAQTGPAMLEQEQASQSGRSERDDCILDRA